jgi:hypothetical protein
MLSRRSTRLAKLNTKTDGAGRASWLCIDTRARGSWLPTDTILALGAKYQESYIIFLSPKLLMLGFGIKTLVGMGIDMLSWNRDRNVEGD